MKTAQKFVLATAVVIFLLTLSFIPTTANYTGQSYNHDRPVWQAHEPSEEVNYRVLGLYWACIAVPTLLLYRLAR